MAINNDRELVVNPVTGEVLSREQFEKEEPQYPIQRRDPRVVDADYRRDLKQFKGFGSSVTTEMSPFQVFQTLKRDIQKVVNYDGYPTVVLGDYAGRTVRVTGGVFRSRHSFKSKDVIDEFTGEGAIMAGYDKLILKVTHLLGAGGMWFRAGNDEQPFLMMETSAAQPTLLFEEAFKKGLTVGDWPMEDGVQGDMCFHIYKSGNAIQIGPADEEFDPKKVKGAKND